MPGIYSSFLWVFFSPLLTCQAGSQVTTHQSADLLLQPHTRWAHYFKYHHNKDQLESSSGVKLDIAPNKSMWQTSSTLNCFTPFAFIASGSLVEMTVLILHERHSDFIFGGCNWSLQHNSYFQGLMLLALGLYRSWNKHRSYMQLELLSSTPLAEPFSLIYQVLQIYREAELANVHMWLHSDYKLPANAEII